MRRLPVNMWRVKIDGASRPGGARVDYTVQGTRVIILQLQGMRVIEGSKTD